MNVTVTSRQSIELDAGAVKECFEHYLKNLCGGDGLWIDDDGTVWEEDEYRHGTPTDSKVKNPSAIQVAALRFKRALDDERRKKYEEEDARRKKAQKASR